MGWGPGTDETGISGQQRWIAAVVCEGGTVFARILVRMLVLFFFCLLIGAHETSSQWPIMYRVVSSGIKV